MIDRDTFAAAALTGLLSNIPRYQLGVIAVQAYDIADEMLRERDRRNLDAVPEAKAKPSDRGPGQSQVGTGNTHKPVAWARFFPNGGPMSVFLDRPPADSEPLYRSPTLTDEERKAIEIFAKLEWTSVRWSAVEEHAATLRKLLERMK